MSIYIKVNVNHHKLYTKTKCHPPWRHFSTASFPLTAVAYFNFRLRKKTSNICALIMLSSTIRTLIGGITPIAEVLFGATGSFSLTCTSGTFVVRVRGDSVCSTTGEADSVMMGCCPLMVLLFRRVAGECVEPPLCDEFPDMGDFGELLPFCCGGFSGGMFGDELMTGRDVDRRC